MMSEQSKQIYKYYKDTGFVPIGIAMGIFFIGFGIFGVTISIDWGIILVWGLGIVLLWGSIHLWVKSRKQIISLEQGPLYNALLSDFAYGFRYLNDGLRIGQTFAIGRYTNDICKISDITRVYQYIHRTNGIEDKRELRVEINNKIKTLCRVRPKRVFKKTSLDDEEMKKIVLHLLKLNPNIKVGYRTK